MPGLGGGGGGGEANVGNARILGPFEPPYLTPLTDPVTGHMTDVMINSITSHMTYLTKIVI